jgi:magnesium chelatase accessory protein
MTPTVVLRGGIRWQVRIQGSGPALLLLHGTGASSESFRALMPLLAARFTVIAPDLPAHAGSLAPPTFEPTLPATSVALAELLTALDVKPTVAVGHSAGAALVARMTIDGMLAPELLVGLGAAIFPLRGLARAVLPATARVLALTSKLVPLSIRGSASVDRLLKSTGSSLDSSGIERYRALSAQPSHVAAVLEMMASWDLEPLYADLPELRTPLLLLAGERDRAVPVRQQRIVAARAPQARVVVIPGAGHLLHEERPAVVARVILEAAQHEERRSDAPCNGGRSNAQQPVKGRFDAHQ